MNEIPLYERVITSVIGIVVGSGLTIFGSWYLNNYVTAGPRQTRFKSLRGTYTGWSFQHKMKDQAILTLETRGRNRLIGIMKVKYQQPDGQLSADVEEMKVIGRFLYDTLLLLEYVNVDKRCKQAGVFSLDYQSDGKTLKGDWAGYYHPRPDDRDDLRGEISFTRIV